MEELLYDRIIKELEKRVKFDKETELKGTLKTLKNETKVILIDEMTLDSLVNEPYSDKSFCGEIKLPFPDIFFEFGKPLKYYYMVNPVTFDLGAVLLFKPYEGGSGKAFYPEEEFPKELIGSDEEEITESTSPIPHECNPENLFDIVLLEEKGYRGRAEIHFSETNPYITFDEFDSDGNHYVYAYDAKLRSIIPIHDLEPGKSIKVGYVKEMGDEELNTLKLANLSVNLINYINAQNVKIKKAYRKESFVSLPGGRKKKPKRFLVQSKPYYWIEIDKKVYEEKEGEPGHSWELEYRVWVRGHFRHYQDGKRIWIEPFVKGPPDAPWKHNRYKVLYNRFKHLLKNPKYIDDNSQENPF